MCYWGLPEDKFSPSAISNLKQGNGKCRGGKEGMGGGEIWRVGRYGDGEGGYGGLGGGGS